jgi:RNA ligase
MAIAADLFDITLLQQMVDERMVAIKQHPSADLWILNYTSAAQYSYTWNDVTRKCRGLIMSGNPLTHPDAVVVARPFEKFFNLSEHDDTGPHGDLPLDRNFDVYGKMDGSLGVLHEGPDGPCIATRGSFASDQAIWATNFLRKNLNGREVPAGTTLLFEIIYPQNRIVVNYGDHEGLTLLAAIDNETGADVEVPEQWQNWLPVVQRYDGIRDVDTILALIAASPQDWANHEGFVLRFDPETPGHPSMRVKAKFSEYVRLHRIVTGVSTKTIWEFLSTGRDFAELLDHVPDEFYDWVHQTADDLRSQYTRIESEALEIMKDPRIDPQNRKETALFFQTQPHKALLFKMLDEKDYSNLIWHQIKPAYEKPFRQDDEA